MDMWELIYSIKLINLYNCESFMKIFRQNFVRVPSSRTRLSRVTVCSYNSRSDPRKVQRNQFCNFRRKCVQLTRPAGAPCYRQYEGLRFLQGPLMRAGSIRFAVTKLVTRRPVYRDFLQDSGRARWRRRRFASLAISPFSSSSPFRRVFLRPAFLTRPPHDFMGSYAHSSLIARNQVRYYH